MVLVFPQYLTSVYVAGEGKGNGEGGKTGSATRMVTRLRNPDSKLSQRKVMQDKDTSSQDSKALKEVRLSKFSFGTKCPLLRVDNRTAKIQTCLKFRNSVLILYYLLNIFNTEKYISRNFTSLIFSLDSPVVQLGQERPRPEDQLEQRLLQAWAGGQIPCLPQPVQHKRTGA